MKEVRPPKRPLIFYYCVAMLILLLFNFLAMPWMARQQIQEVDYGTFMDMAENQDLGQVEIQEQENQIVFTNKDETAVYSTGMIPDPDLKQMLKDSGAEFSGQVIQQTDPILSFLLTWILPIVIFVALGQYLSRRMMKNMGGPNAMAFGKSNAKVYVKSSEGIKFSDVAGEDEAKENLAEIVDYLHNPKKYSDAGASMPKGVLLVGPPGTGKTLLARACAGEAGVPFYSISGSDFVEMYVGVGASRVRDLFDTAKKNPAAIIFIDEIDAVGRHRGAGLGGGHDEREQTLNQILVEMDGFGSSEGVIVMAATNRPDILDPALLRPGRFDRQITMNPPDVKGREDILRVHSRNKPFEADVDLSVIAKTTVGFTGAELANLLNEAALLAARKGKHLIGMNDLEEAMIKVIVGPAKKSHVITEAERRLTAYHEAGHAITTWVRQKDDPVHQISIIPSGRAGGYTLSFPKEDRSYMSRSAMEDEIVTLLGGRVSEMLILGDISTGASNDIQRATSIARQMVTKYGMSDTLGPILYGSESSSDEIFLGRDFNQTRNYSEETASLIDSEIKRIVTKAYKEAESILRENMDRLHFVAAYLIKNEIMEEAQFVRAMTEPDVTLDELEAMVAEKRRKSKEENEAHARRIREEEAKREAQRQKNEAHDKRSIFPIEHSDPKDPPQSPDNTNE